MSFFGVSDFPHEPGYRPQVGSVVTHNKLFRDRFGHLSEEWLRLPGVVVKLHARHHQCLVSWDGYEQWEWISYLEPLSPLEALARAAE